MGANLIFAFALSHKTLEMEVSMAVSKIRAEFVKDVKKVWDIATSLENYSWRSDISKIEVADAGKKFVEVTKDGYRTEFRITALEQCKRYEFDMENDNMAGHWTGIFSYENGVTTIDFTEDVTAKKAFMKPFVKMYLKKQQNTYINDLRKVLEQGTK